MVGELTEIARDGCFGCRPRIARSIVTVLSCRPTCGHWKSVAAVHVHALEAWRACAIACR